MYSQAKSWPFQEARRLLEHLERKGKKPGDLVTFETGYGPSGAPHIGTMAEVLRTLWVMRAFEELTEHQYPTRLIMFSDDYDALRKVPLDMPESMSGSLGLPLTEVPSPYADKLLGSSFGTANNMKLVDFVDDILNHYNGGKVGYSPERSRVSFVSSTEYYKGGKFNDMLDRVWDAYDDIQRIMLPTLGEDRRASYSPFMPRWCGKGEVLQVAARPTGARGYIKWVNDLGAHYGQTSHSGNAKLQWKVDWAMRWVYFDVDYEMSGKDLIDSVKASSEICRVLGGTPPVNLTYELFLDAAGEKISKSRGNGFTVGQWRRYGTSESLMLFMFQNPRAAKRLHAELVPQLEDQLLKLRAKAPEPDDPHWHFTSHPQRAIDSDITYTLLLNLAIVSQSREASQLTTYLSSMRNITSANAVTAGALVSGVIHYAEDQGLYDSEKRAATPEERLAFTDLADRLEDMMPQQTAEEFQYQVYEVGKAHGFDPLRAWFQALYECLLGNSSGPRFGALAELYGLENTIRMLREAAQETTDA